MNMTVGVIREHCRCFLKSPIPGFFSPLTMLSRSSFRNALVSSISSYPNNKIIRPELLSPQRVPSICLQVTTTDTSKDCKSFFSSPIFAIWRLTIIEILSSSLSQDVSFEAFTQFGKTTDFLRNCRPSGIIERRSASLLVLVSLGKLKILSRVLFARKR